MPTADTKCCSTLRLGVDGVAQTAALKSAYTASISAVEASTPTATSGSSFIIRLHYRGSSDLPSHRKIRKALPLAILRRSEREKRKDCLLPSAAGKGVRRILFKGGITFGFGRYSERKTRWAARAGTCGRTRHPGREVADRQPAGVCRDAGICSVVHHGRQCRQVSEPAQASRGDRAGGQSRRRQDTDI